MFIRQLYTGCLSEAAYFIESEGVAAIVDPMRDTDEYEKLAKEKNAAIQYIFETHFHADFISGHLDLAKKTGAKIIYGPQTKTHFPIHLAAEEETFSIGKLTMEVIHTPGHTIESSCYLLKDENQNPYCVFTGDTLFVGDVGRPDLFSGNLSKEELAGYLFESLKKLKALPDETVVYPAHGPGSSCGKNLGPDTFSTIGEQKRTNYAMLIENKNDFIQQVTEGLSEPPQYFPINAKINQQGYDALQEILQRGMKPLTVADFKQKIKDGAVILDTRDVEFFAASFIPGAINIALDGRFAEWAGMFISYQKPVVLLTEDGKEKETIIRLSRVGFDDVVGYLQGGMDAWKKAGEKIDMVINIEPDELAMDLPFDQNLLVVDVRKPAEFAGEHIKGAVNFPLNELNDNSHLSNLDHHNLYVHCESGYRSMIACSLLKRKGFHNLRNISGGFNALKKIPEIGMVK